MKSFVMFLKLDKSQKKFAELIFRVGRHGETSLGHPIEHFPLIGCHYSPVSVSQSANNNPCCQSCSCQYMSRLGEEMLLLSISLYCQ